MSRVPIRTALAVGLLAIALASTGLLLGGALSGLHRESNNDLDDSIVAAQRAATALVAARQDEIRGEALLIATDEQVIDGVARRDWATVARGATSRLRSVSADRLADFVGIYDREEAPLMELPPPGTPPSHVLTGAAGGLAMVNGMPMLVRSAPVTSNGDRVGTVVIGRRLHGLMETITAGNRSLPLVFVANESTVASTLPGAADVRWADAERIGRVTIAGEGYLVRPLTQAPAGRLFLVVRERDSRSPGPVIWSWIAGALAVAAAASAWAAGVLTRALRPRVAPDPRADTLAALATWTPAAVDAASMAPGLELLMRLTRADAGVVYRVDAGVLTVLAHQGFPRPREERRSWTLPESSPGTGSPGPMPASGLLPDLGGGPDTRVARPVTINGQISGVVALATRRRRGFSAEELVLVEAVCHRLAVTAERDALVAQTRARDRRLESLEQRRRAQIQALVDIERELAAELDVERLLTLIIERASTLLDAAGVIWLVDEGGMLIARASHGMPAGLQDARIAVGEGVVGTCARERRGLIVNDSATSGDALPGFEPYGHAMAQPLIEREQAVGVIALNRLAGSPPFTESDLATFETFALQAAIALDNARRFADERFRLAHLAGLLEINKKIGSLMPTEALLSAIAEEAARLLTVDNAGFRLVDGDELVLAGVAGKARETMIRPRIKIGESMTGLVALTGETLVVDDIPTFPGVVPEHRAADQRLGYKTFLGVPLRVGDRTIGVLTFRGVTHFGARDVELAESFAGQAAIALETARLLRESQRYAEQLQALDTVNRQISGSLQFEEVLEYIAAAVARFVDAPYVSVWIADSAGQRLRRQVTISDTAIAALMPVELAYGEGAVGWIAEQREMIPWTDLASDLRFGRRAIALEHGLRFFSGYPIVLSDHLLGVISILRPTPYLLTPEAEPAIRSLTAHAAVAVENARLYSETAMQLRQTRSLLEVAELLNSALEARTLLNQVASKSAQVCGVDRCTIEVWQEGREISITSQFADGRKEPALWRYLTERYRYAPCRMEAHVRAAEIRAPVVIPDAKHTDLLPSDMVELFRIRAILVVPLIRQDRAIGVIDLDYTDRDGTFEKWQVELATAIAGQLALGLDNSRLYAEAQERLWETSTLLAVGQVLSQPAPGEEVMRRVARVVGRAFGPAMVGVYLLDERKEALVPVAGWHVPKELLDRFTRTPFVLARFPALASAWRDGTAVSFADITTDPRIDSEIFRDVPPQSALFVPTKVRGESVGALFLNWWETGRQFRPAELSLIEAVASQVGLGLENAELTRQTQLKLKETETLLEVARALTSTLDLPQLLRHFLRQVQRAIGSDSVGIWLTNSSPHELQAVLGYRVPEERLEAIRKVRVSVDYEFYAEAFRSRRPVFSPDVASDPRIPPSLREGLVTHRSQLFVPIVAKNVAIGGFLAVWWEEPREMSASELALLETIAGQAAVAIENARLFRDNQRRLEDLAALYDVSQTMTGQLDRDALVETLHRQIARVLDARTMVILRYDDLRGEFEVAFRIHRGVPQPNERGRRYPLEAGLVSRIVERRQSIRTEDYVETCRQEGVAPVDGGLPFPYWLGVPMIAGDEVVGVIALRTDAQPYREEDERLLVNIAGLAALAFRSAGLYEERTRAYGELAAAQDQLVQAEKLRALGEMASGIAHDFNNLLTSIIGRTQILLRTITEPRLRQSLTAIEQAALDGAQTVRRIQEFTRQRRDQPFIAVDVNRIVEAALEITQSRWRDEPQGRGIDIRVDSNLGAVPPIAGDPVDLRGALTNLILNAIDAMPTGGVLTVRTRAEAERVIVTIADTGEGMTDEAKRRLFEPFFTTKGSRGTGLGLSMTFGIVSRHGGRIDVESAPGAGATFHLSFPAAAVQTPAETARAVATHRESEPPAHCLVVDDEERVRETLGDLLSLAGHTTVLAGNGEQALQLFKAEEFDLVFTDLAMPGLSGWQVARACKEIHPGVPVLLVTGLGVELSRQEMAAHGVDGVLSKPLKIDEVLDAVVQYRRR